MNNQITVAAAIKSNDSIVLRDETMIKHIPDEDLIVMTKADFISLLNQLAENNEK